MASLTLPKGKTAILVMDCQNDIVDEKGKMAAMNNGAMAKLIKEHNVLGSIARLAEAGRKAGVPIIHVRHAYRPDYADAPQNTPILAGMKQNEILKDGTWGAEIHTDIKRQPSDIVITKGTHAGFGNHDITRLALDVGMDFGAPGTIFEYFVLLHSRQNWRVLRRVGVIGAIGMAHMDNRYSGLTSSLGQARDRAEHVVLLNQLGHRAIVHRCHFALLVNDVVLAVHNENSGLALG